MLSQEYIQAIYKLSHTIYVERVNSEPDAIELTNSGIIYCYKINRTGEHLHKTYITIDDINNKIQ